MIFSVEEVLRATGGRLLRRGDDAFQGVSTDSRTIGEGELYIALKGPRFDGHHFALEALEKKAGGVIIEEERAGDIHWNGHSSRTIILVQDTLRALGDLARERRRRYQTPVVALTGSNGKTTSKEMIAACLETTFPILKNRGNWNNLVGLPLSMLEIAPPTRVGIFEMGTNRRGEIAELAAIAEPDAGIITAISPAHLEFLGSERGVFEEKASLLDSLPADGWAVLPADSRWFDALRKRAPGPVCAVGQSARADLRWELGDRLQDGWVVRYTDRQLGWEACGQVPGLAAHAGEAAGMALALVSRWGYDVRAALDAIARCRLPPMRMERREIGGVTWIDDSYNANPISMRAALDVLAGYPCAGRRILVVGDMLELGAASDRYHRQLGRWIRARPFAAVFGCGDAIGRTLDELDRPGSLAQRAGAPAPTAAALIDRVLSCVRPGDLVLVKASHGIGLDRLVRAAQEREAVPVG